MGQIRSNKCCIFWISQGTPVQRTPLTSFRDSAD